MEKLTPIKRAEIYKKIHNKIENTQALCPHLSDYAPCHWTNKKEFKKVFPEFDLFKPKRLEKLKRWFKLEDANQLEYRKTILEFCIEMAKDAKE